MKKSILKEKADKLAHCVYDLTLEFPKEELFVLTSQIRRAVISVPSNLIEGYARSGSKSFTNHLRISYGSLSEVKYQMYFAYKRGYMSKENYMKFYDLSEEVSKMLWKSMSTMRKKIKDGENK